MIDEKTINDFINRFKNHRTIRVFSGDCSYYFAQILSFRFDGEIMYNAKEKHFCSNINGGLWDIKGRVKANLDWISWRTYCLYEMEEAEKVEKACIMMEDD